MPFSAPESKPEIPQLSNRAGLTNGEQDRILLRQGTRRIKMHSDFVTICLACAVASIAAVCGAGVSCKYCGQEAREARALLSSICPRHPDGFGKGKHALFEGAQRDEYVCVYCGQTAKTLRALVSATCPRHPNGFAKGRHSAYEGSVKTSYTCKYCGQTARSVRALVSSTCPKHPSGFAKGRHSPAR